MVTFSDFSKRLALGQLKNASCVDDAIPGVIAPECIDEILSYTNQGIVDLSTRLPIITKLVDLTFVEGQHSYILSPDNIGTYLNVDETEPFTDNFVKTLEIIDSEGNKHLTETDGHILTPTYNTLRFTTAKMNSLGAKVRIQYQATHSVITAEDSLNLPLNLETALQLFVSSLYLCHINSEESIAKGDKYFGLYLRHLGIDENRDLSSTSKIEEDTRLNDRGFV